MTARSDPRRLTTIGDTDVFIVPELEIPTSPRWLLPGATPEELDAANAALDPRFFGEDGRLIQSVHTYLLKSPGANVLLDTGVGNHKPRAGSIKVFHMLDTPFLARLKAAGVTREQVDLVVCTHMHVDHLGWDTMLVDGEWVPTFPSARYLFARTEFEAFRAGTQAGGANEPIWTDTVEPLVQAGLVDLVDATHEVRPGLRLEPSHGHSPGHTSVVLEAGDRQAVFAGDAMHNPIQVLLPHVASALNGPEAATQARIELLSRYADTGAVLFGAHFSLPCGVRIRRTATGFAPEPIDLPG